MADWPFLLFWVECVFRDVDHRAVARPVERERFLNFLLSLKEAQMRADQCICQEFRFTM
jgi:hypothetical protein